MEHLKKHRKDTKRKEDSRCIYWSKLDKACVQHSMDETLNDSPNISILFLTQYLGKQTGEKSNIIKCSTFLQNHDQYITEPRNWKSTKNSSLKLQLNHKMYKYILEASCQKEKKLKYWRSCKSVAGS